MNRSIDQYILEKQCRPAIFFRYRLNTWLTSWFALRFHRSAADLASPSRGRRLPGMARGHWEVLIP